MPVTDLDRLVGVDHITIAWFAPGIARLGMPVLAQLAGGIDSLAKLSDDLLNRLRVEVRIFAFGPGLPAGLARPAPVQATQAVMAGDEIAPQPRGLDMCDGER